MRLRRGRILWLSRVGIGVLLERQTDIETYRVGGLHDAWTAAGTEDKSLFFIAEGARPCCQQPGQFPGIFIIMG
jgi:hypothetical protein